MCGLLHVLLTVGALVQFSSSDGWKLASGHSGQQKSGRGGNVSLPALTVGLIVPYKSFGAREYTRVINTAVGNLRKGHAKTKSPSQFRFTFLDKYDFTQQQVRSTLMPLTPSPTGKYFPETSASSISRRKQAFAATFLDAVANTNILRVFLEGRSKRQADSELQISNKKYRSGETANCVRSK